MCSIFGILEMTQPQAAMRPLALALSKKLRHRGPDWSGIYSHEKAILVHERLAIVGLDSGAQPLLNPQKTHVLAVNGEIYNHKALQKQLKQPFEFQTQSDCEVILALYQEKGIEFLDELNGIFAFALYDVDNDSWLIGRDHIGIVPLYYGYDEYGQLMVASELKALVEHCKTIEEFPRGHYWQKGMSAPRSYYQRDWQQYDSVKNNVTDIKKLEQGLQDAVRRQMMCDVPYGVLLSGGLDSSLISALAKMYADKRIEDEGQSAAWWPQLHSFAIGLAGSPDLAASRKVADQIGSIHHEYTYTVQEGLDALSDVIYHIETYDVTTVRASTPMYLLARKIKAMGIKMVLSGEGADELFGGYLYFHKAPNPQAFHEETLRKIDRLHWYDCLRANKSMSAWGIEARVPFLDKEFIDIAMRINPADKMASSSRMEKAILREAFDNGLLPKDVLWRQKEQFSDGVGYSWIDSLKQLVESEVSDEQLAKSAFKFAVNPPQSKEEYFYRSMFETHFPGDAAAACVPSLPSVACSTPEALAWDASLNVHDPSGRAVMGVHQQAY
jgi:asparagine synthase (glutamine-hydrolysing)